MYNVEQSKLQETWNDANSNQRKVLGKLFPDFVSNFLSPGMSTMDAIDAARQLKGVSKEFMGVRSAGNFKNCGFFLANEHTNRWKIVIDSNGCQVLVPILD